MRWWEDRQAGRQAGVPGLYWGHCIPGLVGPRDRSLEACDRLVQRTLQLGDARRRGREAAHDSSRTSTGRIFRGCPSDGMTWRLMVWCGDDECAADIDQREKRSISRQSRGMGQMTLRSMRWKSEMKIIC